MRVPPPFIPPIRLGGSFGLCEGATRCGSGCGAWPQTCSCRMRCALEGTAQGVHAAPAWSELRGDKVVDVSCVLPLQTRVNAYKLLDRHTQACAACSSALDIDTKMSCLRCSHT